MSNGRQLVKLVATYVTDLFNRYQTPVLVYHNLLHTLTVVEKAAEIAAQYALSDSDIFTLLSAAWFHDCGHLFGPAESHEARGAVVMQEYMQTIGVEEQIIAATRNCILSTQMPSHPQSLPAEILCDADLYHLGTSDFFITDQLVKKEFESRNIFLPSNWDESSLALLKRHHYFTSYCRNLLNKGKAKNIILLKELIAENTR